MPLYFFHYKTPEGFEPDDLGASFASLELAYLDAYRSMVEIGAELLKQQVNPSLHIIQIADVDGRVLMELRFDEIFRANRRIHPHIARERRTLDGNLAHFRNLRNDINAICESARLSVAKAHEVLRRAKHLA